ncbi:MAG: NAD(P)/FAD-dependent oxidoreductase [Treponema sp.]|jgi:2-enoate reductase|nr:NAD(P)/FAD-dependent oxidoreductase [Treponema sp.]
MKKDALVQEWVDGYGDWFLKEGALDNARMAKNLYPYDGMFSPVTINRLTVKNRLVMAPMGNISMCDETGRPNEKMLQYFYERAKGGVGLITTGLVPVSHGIDHSITELGQLSYFPRIDRSRTVYAGWRDLAQGCHSFGARVFIQLTPGLGWVGNPQCLLTMFKLPVSASWNPSFYIPAIPCAPLSDRKLKKIARNMGQGAVDGKTAGLDGVYLHGHEGYLLEQLSNPAFNRRKLGRYANWQAFGLDCVREIRRRTGPHYPIMYRIDLSLALNETYGEAMLNTGSLKKFTNGRTVEDTLGYMKNLVAAGVDIFDVDLGCYDNWWLPHPPSSMPPGCFLEVSRRVKEYFKAQGIMSNAGVEVPVVGVGKLGYPDLAEAALRNGQCDMVMLGRPLLADPDWCGKAYAGKTEEIRPCIGCQEGCINEFVEGGHPQCAVNPRTGFEHVFPAVPQKAAKPRKIAVVGGGPAGVTAAVVCAERGHQVELINRDAEIGGRLIPGSLAKIKYEAANYRLYLEGLVKKTLAEGNLTVRANTTATLEDLAHAGYDVIIFAQGTLDAELPLPGAEKVKTVQAAELLKNPRLLGGSKKIVVIGGGAVGCETAYWLTFEKSCDVTVVEMDKYIMNHTCTANRGHLIHYLHKAGVPLLNCTRVTGFVPGGIKVSRNVSKTVPDPYLTWHPILPENIENPLAPKLTIEEKEEILPADMVVLAVGGVSDNSLYLAAQKERAAPELYNIGDSFSAGRVLEAVRAAYRLGMRV